MCSLLLLLWQPCTFKTGADIFLFAAEYGLGMFTAMQHRRAKLIGFVQNYIHVMDLKKDEEKADAEKALASLLHDWLDIHEEKSDRCTLLFDKMKPLFQLLLPKNNDPSSPSLLSKVWSERDLFPKISQWIVGGDGWAYDIGFGGLDHVEAFEANDVNVLVVDTGKFSVADCIQSYIILPKSLIRDILPLLM